MTLASWDFQHLNTVVGPPYLMKQGPPSKADHARYLILPPPLKLGLRPTIQRLNWRLVMQRYRIAWSPFQWGSGGWRQFPLFSQLLFSYSTISTHWQWCEPLIHSRWCLLHPSLAVHMGDHLWLWGLQAWLYRFPADCEKPSIFFNKCHCYLNSPMLVPVVSYWKPCWVSLFLRIWKNWKRCS